VLASGLVSIWPLVLYPYIPKPLTILPKSGLVVSVLDPMNSLQSAPKILHPLGHSSFLLVCMFEAISRIFIFTLCNLAMLTILWSCWLAFSFSQMDVFVWSWFWLGNKLGTAAYPLYTKTTLLPVSKSGLVVYVLEPINSLHSAPKNSSPTRLLFDFCRSGLQHFFNKQPTQPLFVPRHPKRRFNTATNMICACWLQKSWRYIYHFCQKGASSYVAIHCQMADGS